MGRTKLITESRQFTSTSNWVEEFKAFFNENSDIQLKSLRILSNRRLGLVPAKTVNVIAIRQRVIAFMSLHGAQKRIPKKFRVFAEFWQLCVSRGVNKVNSREFFASMIKYFYRQGLANHAIRIVSKILFNMYLREQQHGLRLFSKFFRKVIKAVDSINVPLKLVPRFIRRRVRKIPKFASLRFQRARTWRALSLLGKNATYKSEFAIAAELNKLYLANKDSLLISKLPQIYKDLYKGRVYIRRRRRGPSDLFIWYKKLIKGLFKKLVRKGLHVSSKTRYLFISKTAAEKAVNAPKVDRFLRLRVQKMVSRVSKAYNFHLTFNRYIGFLYGYNTRPSNLRHA